MKTKHETVDRPTVRGLRDSVIDTAVSVGRLLPRGRTTLFHLAHWATGRPERVIGTVDRQRFCVDVKDEGIALRAYLMDEWEPEVSRVILSLLKPGNTFVDVGANKGYFCLLAAKRVQPGGRIVSYEPHPANSRDIDVTVAENAYNHWANRAAAASSKAGTAKLYTPGWSAGMSGWGSIHRPCDDFIEVETVTLDEDLESQGIERVDVMKVDVEGHEIEVLEGATQCLTNRRIGSLLVEVHLTELQDTGIARLFDLMSRFDLHAYTIDEHKLRTPSVQSRTLRPTTCDEIQSIDKTPKNRPHVLWSKQVVA